MGPIPEHELFSAYLDGELTSAEQARVEQLLATSSAARQLLEELRALSHTLQSLPGERLSEDISACVLREAERRMLAESPRPLPSTGYGSMVGPDWTAIFRRLFRPRVMIWSAVAVAIALMFTLQDHSRPELAQTPPSKAAQQQVAHEMAAKPPAPAASLATESAAAAKSPSAPEATQVANTPTDQQSVPAEDAVSPPLEPREHPNEPPKPQTLVAAPAAETAPTPTVEAAPAAPSEVQSPAKPSQAPLVVYCDIRADAVEEGLLDKLLSEQQIAKQADVQDDAASEAAKSDEATDSGKAIRVRVAISDAQLAALVAQLRAHPEAFVSVAVESPQPSEADSSSSAVAESGTRRGTAASVKVQGSSGRAKPTPKSRVIFEPNAPPPPSPKSLPAGSSSAAESRPVVFVLHVIDTADPAPSAESKSAQE